MYGIGFMLRAQSRALNSPGPASTDTDATRRQLAAHGHGDRRGNQRAWLETVQGVADFRGFGPSLACVQVACYESYAQTPQCHMLARTPALSPGSGRRLRGSAGDGWRWPPPLQTWPVIWARADMVRRSLGGCRCVFQVGLGTKTPPPS